MTNLTISIDDETLKAARIRALQENTSVNALVNRFISEYAGADQQKRERLTALSKIREQAAEHGIRRDQGEWNRDDLYDR